MSRPLFHRPHIHRPRLHRPHLNRPHIRPGETIWFLFDKNLRPRLKNVVFQCGLATLSLVVILLVQNIVFSLAVVVAIASSAFIIFVFPDSLAATPRRVIGGQFVAAVAGSLFFGLLQIPAAAELASEYQLIVNGAAGLAVGLTIFLMVATNTEHPPAAGVALGLVIDPWQWATLVFVLTGALALSVIRAALRRRMVNLL